MFTEDYEVMEALGSGTFGVVYKCKSRATGEIFAVKAVNKSKAKNDCVHRLALANEPRALTLLSPKPNSSLYITRLHGKYESPTHLKLVLDFCPSPTLIDYLMSQEKGVVSEDVAKRIFASLMHGILHCHQNGVVHRDIKPDNIFYDPGTQRVKLCDFGAAGFLDDGAMMTDVVGTPNYVAPEVLLRVGYGEKVDVWSAGVVLYEMLAGFLPFRGEKNEDVFAEVLRGHLKFPSRFSSSVKDLLERMLSRDVSTRLSVKEVFRHPWMANAKDMSQKKILSGFPVADSVRGHHSCRPSHNQWPTSRTKATSF